jgi:deoxyadenosine/deoxycytidine kinase
MESDIRYIVVEGVIGAGKTSLAKKLAQKLNSELILEQFEINPFLEKFYQDRKRYAFQTQMFFLVNRFKQQENILQGNLFFEKIVADYFFDKDRIFAHLNLKGDELNLYEQLFSALSKNILKPNLTIYLRPNVDRLMLNIKKRNRKIEENISRDYIEELDKMYRRYFEDYDKTQLLIVDSTELDFVNNERDFYLIFDAIFNEKRRYKDYLVKEKNWKIL